MRNLISIVIIWALVITTTMASAVSHAMPHDGSNAIQTTKSEAAKGHDCHGHEVAKASSEKTTKNDASDKCCDKGMCKCVGGNCHNGPSQMLNNGSDSLLFGYRQDRFGFGNESADSALSEGLKRPPRT